MLWSKALPLTVFLLSFHCLSAALPLSLTVFLLRVPDRVGVLGLVSRLQLDLVRALRYDQRQDVPLELPPSPAAAAGGPWTVGSSISGGLSVLLLLAVGPRTQSNPKRPLILRVGWRRLAAEESQQPCVRTCCRHWCSGLIR